MSRNWIVRQGAPSIEADKNSKTVLIRTARRVSIHKDDVLVLLDADYVFTHVAAVVEVSRKRDSAQTPDSKTATEIAHTGWRALDPPVEFELFTSSLTFVKNLDRPKLHLRPGYRTLSDTDRETIEAGEPFLAREAYLTLLGALPESMKRIYLADQLLAEGIDNVAPFRERVITLLQFIDTRILRMGEMIIKLDETWEEVRKLADAPRSVEPVFSSDDEAVAPDDIRVQANQFRKVQSLIGTGQTSPTAFELMREAMRSQEQDARIERLEKFFSRLPA